MREVSAMFDTMDGAVKEALRSSSPCCAVRVCGTECY